MTIEFESQGSRLLAVSVPNKKGYELAIAMKEVLLTRPKESFTWLGYSSQFKSHHEAMKEAGIHHVNPYDNPKQYVYSHVWQEAQNRTSEVWILLKIKE